MQGSYPRDCAAVGRSLRDHPAGGTCPSWQPARIGTLVLRLSATRLFLHGTIDFRDAQKDKAKTSCVTLTRPHRRGTWPYTTAA
jgi:hypothetical protein